MSKTPISKPTSRSRTTSRSRSISRSVSRTTRPTTTPTSRPATRSAASPTSRTARSRTTSHPQKLPLPTKIIIFLIGLSVLCVAFATFCSLYFTPARAAATALERLASDYYIEYYYPSVLGSQISSPEPIMSAHAASGLPPVRLRQILLRTSEIEAAYSSYFSNPSYTCDLNSTLLRFYPVAPYGPRDYTLKITYSCQDLTS